MLPEELESQARSVTHLATYLEELKDAARRLRERAAVRERGYFSPGEEEAARQLLISYWMAPQRWAWGQLLTLDTLSASCCRRWARSRSSLAASSRRWTTRWTPLPSR